MATVYRYDYLDRVLKRDRRSIDYATGEAIGRLGGTILAETAREVDDALVDEWGMVRAVDIAASEPVPPLPAEGGGAINRPSPGGSA
jgi:hypothetical protein